MAREELSLDPQLTSLPPAPPQVMLGVAPPPLFRELWQRGFQGSLLELSLDGSANFVVQAALAALKEPAQVLL